MKFWYIKKFSQIIGLPLSTLYYYDKIRLLKPIINSDNKYRIYTGVHLEKAQYIVALTSFGFSIKEIKKYYLKMKIFLKF